MRHHIVSTDAGFLIRDEKLNAYVGDGKGNTLTLSTHGEAETVMGELSARLAWLGTFATPEPILPALPSDSDNDGGYDQDDYPDLPALLSATSVTMRSLFG